MSKLKKMKKRWFDFPDDMGTGWKATVSMYNTGVGKWHAEIDVIHKTDEGSSCNMFIVEGTYNKMRTAYTCFKAFAVNLMFNTELNVSEPNICIPSELPEEARAAILKDSKPFCSIEKAFCTTAAEGCPPETVYVGAILAERSNTYVALYFPDILLRFPVMNYPCARYDFNDLFKVTKALMGKARADIAAVNREKRENECHCGLYRETEDEGGESTHVATV